MKRVALAVVLAAVSFTAVGCLLDKSPVSVEKTSVNSQEQGSPVKKPGVEPAYVSDYVRYPINPWLPLNAIAFGAGTSRGLHLGDDCRRDPGTSVYAIFSGTVKYVGYHSGEGNWGWIMIVESYLNGMTFCTVYGHLSGSNLNRTLRCVTTGEKIGEVGHRWENGYHVPHLHLGMHAGGFGAPWNTYPSWCRGYGSTSGWYNPTWFIANY